MWRANHLIVIVNLGMLAHVPDTWRMSGDLLSRLVMLAFVDVMVCLRFCISFTSIKKWAYTRRCDRLTSDERHPSRHILKPCEAVVRCGTKIRVDYTRGRYPSRLRCEDVNIIDAVFLRAEKKIAPVSYAAVVSRVMLKHGKELVSTPARALT